jgi:predicted component of type VI protein secretion system
MAKLVLLSEGFTGRTHELVADKTTVGRVEDNALQLADPSVSSHHCEILLRGSEVVVKDLNSTNGTFIDGEPVAAETVVKHGQVLRLGHIQMRLETAAGAAATAAKKAVDSTMVMDKRGGVSLNELEKGPHGAGFQNTDSVFAKKSSNPNFYFLLGGIVLMLIIIGGIIVAFLSVNKQ